VTDSSVSAVIEMVDVALRSYFTTPASEHKLTNREVIQEAIGAQDHQGYGAERYAEQGNKASLTASRIPPGPDFQRYLPEPSLPYSVEES
jgi:hypothetical protein